MSWLALSGLSGAKHSFPEGQLASYFLETQCGLDVAFKNVPLGLLCWKTAPQLADATKPWALRGRPYCAC